MKNNWSMFHIKYLYKSLFKNTFTQFTEKREEERLYATSWSNIHPSRAWKIVRARNAAERRNKRICSRSKQPARETKNQDGLTERERENNGTACLGWILERNRIAKFSIALRTNFYIPIELRPIKNKNTKIKYNINSNFSFSNRIVCLNDSLKSDPKTGKIHCTTFIPGLLFRHFPLWKLGTTLVTFRVKLFNSSERRDRLNGRINCLRARWKVKFSLRPTFNG